MNKQHKWHKEIKHWADGGQIEAKEVGCTIWKLDDNPYWDDDEWEYRIKPQLKLLEPKVFIKEFECTCGKKWNFQDAQPKEPKYLYVYSGKGKVVLNESKYPELITQIDGDYEAISYIGKIKLEQDDED